MTIKYFLFLVFAGNMQLVGPFDGLIACEKAASQVRAAVNESQATLFAAPRFDAVCLSQKHRDFKYKEPGK